MKHACLCVIYFGVFALGFEARAQSSLEGLTTGRYELHSAKLKAPKSESSRRPASAQADDEVIVQSTVVKVETKSENTTVVKTEKPTAEILEKKSVEVAVKPVSPVDNSEEKVEPNLADQAQSLFTAKTEKIYDFYREQVHPDDIRNNKVEIEFAPTAVYNDSSSNYSFREYNSYFTALKLKANVWLTPLIGLSGQMLFSLGSDIDANDGTRSRVATKYDNLDLGLNFRKFFGISRKSNSIETSLLYSDYKFSPSSDSTARLKTKTTGFGLGVKARFPTSASYAWTLGGSFFPRLTHDESENAVAIESGSIMESSRLGLDFGGEFKFSRESQLVWNLGLSSERNQFDGAASLVDPQWGLTPSHVSVTNTIYMFSLGYRWGH